MALYVLAQAISILTVGEGSSELALSGGPTLSLFDMLLMTRGVLRT